MAPLRIIIVPREEVAGRDALLRDFAELPECQVIVDRRTTERRRSQPPRESAERRHGDRRSGDLETAAAAVLFVH